MMDTDASRGIADSLPLTSLALDGALLKWGLFDSAMAKVGFYFSSFVYANGTIDMGHWKDKWADLGDGTYNCTYSGQSLCHLDSVMYPNTGVSSLKDC